MPSIPSEIIEQILLQSPAKSLVRFKRVSKEWNSIISDPRFIKIHTHQLLLQPQPAKKLIAMSTTTRSLYSIELTIDNIINGIPATPKAITLGSPSICWNNILGSCNGLVLAIDVNDTLFLMNPTTHDLCKLPVNPFAYVTDMYYYCYGFGFGYDSSTDDYKIVFVWSSYKRSISYNNIVSIYSLRYNSWRKLPNTPHDDLSGASGGLVNGNCHWLAEKSPSIIAFSFVDQLFSEIKPPDSVLDNNLRWINDVVEIGGRLGVYLGTRESASDELWVMQEYGDAKSWTRVFSRGDYMKPLCFLKGSDRYIVLEGIYDDDVVVVFDMMNEEIQKHASLVAQGRSTKLKVPLLKALNQLNAS